MQKAHKSVTHANVMAFVLLFVVFVCACFALWFALFFVVVCGQLGFVAFGLPFLHSNAFLGDLFVRFCALFCGMCFVLVCVVLRVLVLIFYVSLCHPN